ncbi:MAG TPA: carbon storage regulator [Fimbriiglobus sp.]|nr:carbon storage regulator [Fimbriiglobus sp.]
MEQEIGPAVLDNPELGPLVRRAAKLLAKQAEGTLLPARARWDLGQDERNRPVVRVEVSDETGSVNASFSPVELSDEAKARDELIWLWGDMLQVRSDRLMDQLLLSVLAEGETLTIGDTRIKVVKVGPGQVKLGIETGPG